MNRREFELRLTDRANATAFYWFKTRRKAIEFATRAFLRRDIDPIDSMTITRRLPNAPLAIAGEDKAA